MQPKESYEDRTGLNKAFRADDDVPSATAGLVTGPARGGAAGSRGVVGEGVTYEHITESITVVKVSVGLDVLTAPRLREALVETIHQGRYFLVVDLSDVEVLDSTGVGVLAGGLKRVRFHGGELVAVAASEGVLKQFWITGLSKLIPVFDAVHPAVEHLGRRGTETHA
ncbi:anti-sigma B factor antagonist [Streptomyces sp. DI166]|nr:anti-sigma B factor antagonist [Streptomyces sp. DI166]